MKLVILQSCALALGTATAALSPLSSDRGQAASRCKCFPGDACWPSAADWSGLNATVGGRLIKTVPLGAPCHDPGYSQKVCKNLQSQWQAERVHMESSSSIMAPFFANQSCDPLQPRSRHCELGNYVRYAVNATSAEDVQATMAFAQRRNLRFVVRNTGHDYLGRSTGAGALAIWTHHLKSIEFLLSGRQAAVKLGAGVQGYEIMKAARDRGLVVVGGECPTVGIAGGYTQGGGHSALSTNFGLSADNVLSWDVVAADGKLRTASKTENPDLYWALSGGGGGTFGVVVSMTVKAFPDAVVSGATLSFYTTNNTRDDLYAGVQAFHEALPAMVGAGLMVNYYFTTEFFQIFPLTAYDKRQDEVRDILEPFESTLESLGVNYTVAYSQSKTYYAHFDKYFGPLPLGNIKVGIAQYAGRLIPRAAASTISTTWRFVVEQGVTWIGVGTDVSSFGGSNSVHPAWRDALVSATLTLPWSFESPWSDMVALQDKMTNVVMPAVEAATPGGGSDYDPAHLPSCCLLALLSLMLKMPFTHTLIIVVNEGDWRQPNFQQTFWGTNYPRLLVIKKKYDPDNFFYVTKGVGSEAWVVAKDGRMCVATGPKDLV
ncbi:FAD binding domain-containing protein [Apiospora saccharicola]